MGKVIQFPGGNSSNKPKRSTKGTGSKPTTQEPATWDKMLDKIEDLGISFTHVDDQGKLIKKESENS